MPALPSGSCSGNIRVILPAGQTPGHRFPACTAPQQPSHACASAAAVQGLTVAQLLCPLEECLVFHAPVQCIAFLAVTPEQGRQLLQLLRHSTVVACVCVTFLGYSIVIPPAPQACTAHAPQRFALCSSNRDVHHRQQEPDLSQGAGTITYQSTCWRLRKSPSCQVSPVHLARCCRGLQRLPRVPCTCCNGLCQPANSRCS